MNERDEIRHSRPQDDQNSSGGDHSSTLQITARESISVDAAGEMLNFDRDDCLSGDAVDAASSSSNASAGKRSEGAPDLEDPQGATSPLAEAGIPKPKRQLDFSDSNIEVIYLALDHGTILCSSSIFHRIW